MATQPALPRPFLTAGWYNLAIGIAALPASVLFGLIWDRAGSGMAFTFGAALATVGALALAAVPTRAGPSGGVPSTDQELRT